MCRAVRSEGRMAFFTGDVMTTKNWTAQAVLMNRTAGKVNRKHALAARAASVVRTAAIEALESRQMLTATLTISGSPNPVNEGSAYTLNVTPSADANLTSWSVNWGDGNTSGASGSPPATLQHVYADGPNNFTINASGTSANGGTVGGTLDVTFNGNGKVIDGPGIPDAVVMEPDGKILVA